MVGLFDEAVDGGLEIDDGTEHAASEAPPGELCEEALDGVEPRCRCRREVEDKARMPGEPRHHLRVLVGGVVVEDDMNDLSDRHLGLDGVEEADELLMPVALHAAPDHGTFQHVERREQRGGAIALVVV